jgi:hypothetical protein
MPEIFSSPEIIAPKGLRNLAQGYGLPATLGCQNDDPSTPTGLRPVTVWPGYAGMTQPRWGWEPCAAIVPRVATLPQPWAMGRNPVGIL